MKKETLLQCKEDNPIYKIVNEGRRSVTNNELIAAIIGNYDTMKAISIAGKLMLHCNNSLNDLAKMSIFEMQVASGLSINKCAQITAAIELGRRHQIENVVAKTQIRTSRDIYDLFYNKLSDLNHEEFWVAHLNKGNRVVSHSRHSIGGIAGTVVDIKLILKESLSKEASAIILMHNHPSGNLQPSDADVKVTEKLKNACALLEIALLDHVIFGDKSYTSFADEGIL